MKSVSENIQLSKDLSRQFPWSRVPHSPACISPGGVEGRQLQQRRVQSLQKQAANTPVVGQSPANALGKCQFAVGKAKCE